MMATVQYNDKRIAAIRVPPLNDSDLARLKREMEVPAKAVRSLIHEWTQSKVRHRECLIRAALLRFLTPAEIELTSKTGSKALLDYYGLVLEHINPPGALRSGMKAFIPETLRVYQHGKLVLSVNLEMNREAA